MDKVVILKSIGGGFDQGFNFSLSIALEGQLPTLEVVAPLPPNGHLVQSYEAWKSAYWSLGYQSRIASRPAIARSPRADCRKAAAQLKQELDQWLRAPEFSPIRDKLQEQLQPTDAVRLILQVDDCTLQCLPWQTWELLDRYRSTEVALASPVYQAVQTAGWAGRAVKILAILGDSTGIDVDADRKFLEELPNAEVTFLVEPKRQVLSQQLWDKGWDILFFSGHSSSDVLSNSSSNSSSNSASNSSNSKSSAPNSDAGSNKRGHLWINSQEKLPIAELKYALRRSVDQGLQLAIFNSCDGLGLALDLADLLIPQTIFMREPVPDVIAQKFLKNFLSAFVYDDQTLYQSVRSARERLETEESDFICASWLPMIFQNLAAQPVRWNPIVPVPFEPTQIEPTQIEPTQSESTQIEPNPLAPLNPTSPTRMQWIRQGAIVLCSSLLMAGAVSWVRHRGFLQAIELKAYDQTLQTRSVLDSKRSQSPILVMTIDEDDSRMYRNPSEDLSISTPNLIKLLTKLRQANVKVIGLDLFRNPKNLPAAELKAFQQMDNVVGTCFNPYDSNPGKRVPQGLENLVGFSDMSPDPDQTIRRHLISMKPDPIVCPPKHSLSMTVTAQYLGITTQSLHDRLRSINAVMTGEDRPGVYQQSVERDSLRYPDDYGNVLVNYGASPIETMSIGDFMNDRAGRTDLTGKIVLIGVARPGSSALSNQADDYHPTPLSDKLPGVIIHAEKASHLLRMLQEKESPLWIWTERSEWIWIWVWAAGAGCLMLLGSRDWRWQVVKLGTVLIVLYGSVIFILMHQRGWVPLIPNVAAIVLTSGAMLLLTSLDRNCITSFGKARYVND